MGAAAGKSWAATGDPEEGLVSTTQSARPTAAQKSGAQWPGARPGCVGPGTGISWDGAYARTQATWSCSSWRQRLIGFCPICLLPLKAAL